MRISSLNSQHDHAFATFRKLSASISVAGGRLTYFSNWKQFQVASLRNLFSIPLLQSNEEKERERVNERQTEERENILPRPQLFMDWFSVLTHEIWIPMFILDSDVRSWVLFWHWISGNRQESSTAVICKWSNFQS